MPSPSSKSAVHLLIHGRVQGVGFRYYTQEIASELGLAGWVRNMPDGAVEAYAEGSRQALEAFIKHLHKGPPLSHVETIIPAWQTAKGTLPPFSIR